MARLNINLDDEIYKEFKKWCLEHDTTVTDVIKRFIEEKITGKAVKEVTK